MDHKVSDLTVAVWLINTATRGPNSSQSLHKNITGTRSYCVQSPIDCNYKMRL